MMLCDPDIRDVIQLSCAVLMMLSIALRFVESYVVEIVMSRDSSKTSRRITEIRICRKS